MVLMDPNVRCPKKAVKLIHVLTHSPAPMNLVQTYLVLSYYVDQCCFLSGDPSTTDLSKIWNKMQYISFSKMLLKMYATLFSLKCVNVITCMANL